MKGLKLFLWMFVICIIRSCFLNSFRIFGIAPEILYVFALCVAMNEKKPKIYLTIGILCGLIADITSGLGYGFYLMSYSISVVLLIVLGDFIYKDNPLILAPIVFVFSILSGTAFFYVNYNFMGSTEYADALLALILPVALYNTVLCVLLNYLLYKTVYEKKRKKKRI